jgi:hypothetical protein
LHVARHPLPAAYLPFTINSMVCSSVRLVVDRGTLGVEPRDLAREVLVALEEPG